MFFIYGHRQKLVSAEDVPMYQCPFCNEMNTTTLAVYSKYFHLFWIPVLPYSKGFYAGCNSCGAGRDEARFGPELLKHSKEILLKIKHPWYMYLCVVIIGLMITALLIGMLA